MAYRITEDCAACGTCFQSARLALFQRVTSIRSIQTLALTAVLAKLLAQWVQS